MRFVAVVLFVVACAPRIDVGAPCTYNSDCPEPNACVAGRCGSECNLHADCVAGGRCVFLAPAIGRCFIDAVPQCGMSLGDCAAGLSCVERRCYAPCSACPADGRCVDDRCERVPPDAG